MKVVYHGGGFVGLAGAAFFARAGHDAVVFDVSKSVVDRLNDGDTAVIGLKEFLQFSLKDLVASGKLRATDRFEEVAGEKVHIVAVPTEAGGYPEMGIVRKVVDRLAKSTPKGALIIIESTLEPGCAKKMVESCRRLGRRIGEDLFFGVAPRRDWLSEPAKNVERLKRVAGGVTDACRKKVFETLSLISRDIELTDYETAEMVKAVENSLLHVPVVYCNQLARIYQDINMKDVIRLAGTHWRIPQYFVSMGVGGYCVPLGTRYLQARKGMTIADEVSAYELEGRRVIGDFLKAWAKRRRLKKPRAIIVGLSYKTACKVHQFSPTMSFCEMLRKTWELSVADPFFSDEEIRKLTRVEPFDAKDARACDVLLVVTAHPELGGPEKWLSRVRKGGLVLDSVGAWEGARPQLEARGVDYRRVGQAGWLTP